MRYSGHALFNYGLFQRHAIPPPPDTPGHRVTPDPHVILRSAAAKNLSFFLFLDT
jgi:hypothetical protein